jgi:hypothetical protein
VCLTHKIGLPREITISFGIIGEGVDTRLAVRR